MATPESKVKTKIKAILKEHGVYYAMPIGTGYGNAGVPDFLCCVKGRFLAIEAKAGKGVTTALQVKNLREVEAAGGVATGSSHRRAPQWRCCHRCQRAFH